MSTASEICSLVDTSGIGALSRAYAISRRQAEAFEVQARRVLALGADPVMVPGDAVGTVRAAQRPPEPAAVPEPSAEESMEDRAQARARAILATSGGHRDHAMGTLEGSIATLERNISHGYTDWQPELDLLKRVQELTQGAR